MFTGFPAGLTTPALVVDADVLERNIARMAEAARAGGFALRPHAKTHKCLAIADRQLEAGAVGLTVATISEAEAFARGGATDLFIAYPLWGDDGKARRLRRLAETVALRLAADSPEGARRLGEAVRGSARPVEMLVEIDSGHHRTGVRPADAGSVGKAAADGGLDVVGVFTFPGHGYGHDAQARERAARDEERALGEATEALSAVGLPARVVSGGSTPTAGRWQPGIVSELRPGVYVFNDATQLALGSCTRDDLALVAAATVVSVPAQDASCWTWAARSSAPTPPLGWPATDTCRTSPRRRSRRFPSTTPRSSSRKAPRPRPWAHSLPSPRTTSARRSIWWTSLFSPSRAGSSTAGR
ncbi:hypothetical protein GCM10027168_73280 [Streptomyces capparidis]